MTPGLQSQTLRAILNKKTEKLYQTAYKPRVGNYFIAVRKT